MTPEELQHMGYLLVSASNLLADSEDARATALWQEQRLVDAELLAAVHGAGGVVYAWTVDSPERMRRLLTLGVDGICTNTPDVGREVVDAAEAA